MQSFIEKDYKIIDINIKYDAIDYNSKGSASAKLLFQSLPATKNRE